MAKKTLAQDYKFADLSKTKVFLIEAGLSILSAYPEILSIQAEKDLTDLGVKVLKGEIAHRLSALGVYVGSRFIPCRTIIWAAGVKPESLVQNLRSPKDASGRLLVNQDLSLTLNSHVFAIGDAITFRDKKKGILPGLAPVAIQQGHHVAEIIMRNQFIPFRPAFTYRDRGIMATIGRSRAVVKFSDSFQLTGFIAWLIWVFVHIFSLMRFKNRVFILLQWTWGYFSFGQGARLIVHKSWRFYGNDKLRYDND